MDYLVESSLILNDKASKPLLKLIETVDKAHAALTDLDRLLGLTTRGLQRVGIAGTTAGAQFARLNTEMTSAGRRMQNVADRTLTLGTRIEGLKTDILPTTFAMADMATEAERVATTMDLAAKASVAAGQAARAAGSGFRAGMRGGAAGGGRSGGGGGGGGSREGIGSRIGGFASGAIGNVINTIIGIDIAKAALRPSLEYQQAQMALRMMGGLNSQQLAGIDKLAKDTAMKMPTTTITGNLETFKELYGVLAHPEMTAALLPDFQKLRAALSVAGGQMPNLKGHENESAKAVARAAEMFGQAGSAEDMRAFMPKILKSYVATGGVVKPDAFRQVSATMRTARYGKDEEFLFGVLPYFIQEMASKGGSTGGRTGPMFQNLNRMLNGGVMTKSVAGGLQSLGLLPNKDDSGKPIKLDTSTIHTIISAHMLKDASLLQKNPFEWATTVMAEAIAKKSGFKDRAQMQKLPEAKQVELINKYVGSAPGTALDALTQMILMESQIRRHIQVYQKVPELNDLYNESLTTTAMKLQEVNMQFDNLLTVMGKSRVVTAPLNAALDGLTGALQGLIGFVSGLDKNIKDLTAMNPALGHIFTTLNQIIGLVTNLVPGANGTYAQQREGAVAGAALAGGIGGGAAGFALGGPIGATIGFVGGAMASGGAVLGALPAHPGAFTGHAKRKIVGHKNGMPIFAPHASQANTPSGMAVPPPPVIPTGASAMGMGMGMGGGVSIGTLNIDVRGHADPKKAGKQAAESFFDTLMKGAFMHNNTTTGAGGHLNTPQFSGGK